MTDETGTDLETIPDNLPAVEREIERVEEAMTDTYQYARSPKTQRRATALYEAAERLKADPAGAHGAQVPGNQAVALTDGDVSNAIENIAAVGEVGREWAKELGSGENARNALQVGEDQRLAMLAAMGDSAGDVQQSFEGLDNNVQMAIYRELSTTYSEPQPAATADQMATFMETEHGALVAADWGSKTSRRLATALHRWERMTVLLTDAEDAALHGYFWRMTAQERAAILMQLGK